ncbi:hypothetical protein JW877_04955 [bacterium]|nr:hypothetical protein [bacterium]
MNIRLYAILTLLLVLTGFTRAQGVNDSLYSPWEPNPTKATLLSLTIPGTGQIYNRKYVKGALVMLTEAYLWYAVLDNQRIANNLLKKRDLVEENSSEYYHYRNEFEKHIGARNDNIWLLVGVKLFSIVDAYVDAQLFRFEDEMGEQFALKLEWKKQTPYLFFQYNFN